MDVSGAADSGDAGAKRFGNLYGESPHAPGGAVDEDVLACLNFAFIAKALQGGDAGDGDGRSLFPGEVRWLQSEARLGCTPVFGEGAGGRAEDCIARFEACDIAAGRFYDSGNVCTEPAGFGRANSCEQANKGRCAADKVPVVWVDRGCVDLDEYLVVCRRGLFKLLVLQHVRRAVVVVDDCFHRLHSEQEEDTEWRARRFPHIYSVSSASAWLGNRPAYLVIPTMVNTLVKCAERPKATTFCPALVASISSWMTSAMPLELM